MSSRRATAGLAAAVVVAVAVRALFLHWSPLPATLDGFRYASLAVDVHTTGRVPVLAIDADELVTTLVLAVASEVTGVRPLSLAQPLVAVAGGVAALAGYVVVRTLGRSRNWSRTQIRRAGVLAVAALAVEGLFVRRTGVPDEEAFGLLLLPLFALAVHRAIQTRRRRWLATVVVVGGAYPLLHNFSGIAGALVATALAAAHVARSPDTRTVGVAVAIAGGYWAYFFGYFAVAKRLGLRLTYSGLITDHPGSLAAWVVVVAIGVAWLRVAAARGRQAAFGIPLVGFFLVAGANVVRPVFPGTLQTPMVVLALVAIYLIPVAVFLVGVPRVGRGESTLVLALLAGPLALVLYTLTTALTPKFFGAVMRAQTFLHIAVFAVAAVAIVDTLADRRHLGRALAVVFLLAAVATAPLAFVHLDTGTAPRTVHESEFAAASFASQKLPGRYVSDHRLARAGDAYYRGTSAGVGPVRAWLYGGPPPDCPTLAQYAWTTEAAHFYPSPAARLSTDEYRAWTRSVDVVYVVGGRTETVLGVAGGC